MSHSSTNKITEIEKLIDKGNYKEASRIFSELNIDNLKEKERDRLKEFKNLLKPDPIYIVISIAVALMGIGYFLLVK